MSEVDCPVCSALAKEKPENKCKHREPLQIGYGFGRVSGWRGLGVTYRCPDCAETLWFEDDYENDGSERDLNNEKRKENIKYKDWKSE